MFRGHVVAIFRYSMGGFGAFQLGGFAPDAFDVVISVAGYGLGTLEPEGGLEELLKAIQYRYRM